MTAIPSDLFFREHRGPSYNCLHFTVEVWRRLFGLDISHMLPAFDCPYEGAELRMTRPLNVSDFKKTVRPKDKSLCLFRSAMRDSLHIGTYINRKVLHLDAQGVKLQPLEIVTISFKGATFYEHLDHHKP